MKFGKTELERKIYGPMPSTQTFEDWVASLSTNKAETSTTPPVPLQPVVSASATLTATSKPTTDSSASCSKVKQVVEAQERLFPSIVIVDFQSTSSLLSQTAKVKVSSQTFRNLQIKAAQSVQALEALSLTEANQQEFLKGHIARLKTLTKEMEIGEKELLALNQKFQTLAQASKDKSSGAYTNAKLAVDEVPHQKYPSNHAALVKAEQDLLDHRLKVISLCP